MDSFTFSLLKYWRPSGLVTSAATAADPSPYTDTDDEGEDGSFFELEFTSVPADRSVSESDTEVSDPDPKSPVSLLKSATRFRVFAMGGLKKLKPDPNAFFIEVFRSSKQSKPEEVPEEKRFVVQKYISKIKPLYIRVSRRYGEKIRFSGPLTAGGGDAKGAKQMVKSRSAVAAVTSPPAAAHRRDDSLLQQEDGIQSAIAHCKRSFNACSKETKTSLPVNGEEK